MNTSTNDAQTQIFVVNAVDYLYQYFDVDQPLIFLNCERTCRWAADCKYLACYQPWDERVSFKTGSERGYIVAHEFAHHLQKVGLITIGGEPGAMTFERWWIDNMSEVGCEVCGDPLFIHDGLEPGTEVICETCDSVYEAVLLD